MVAEGHPPEWPDKAMFAALLLIVGGALGLLVEGLRMVATVKSGLPAGILDLYPTWLSVAMSAFTLVFGILSLRAQAALFGYLGAATGLLSLAYAGLVPGLSLLAIALLVKSRMEGEETRNDGVTLHSSQWPDKAMAASLFLAVGAGVLLVQGIEIALDAFQPILLRDLGLDWLAATLDLVAALVMLAAARDVYNLRRPLLGVVGAFLGLVTFGLYALGPVLALLVLVLLRLAKKEDEFSKHGAQAQGPVDGEAPAKKAAKPKRAKAT
jgi:hypothetical protein